ncbi:MAG: C25 family cysteine peptidase [Bacteroidota bacterium]
MKKFLLLLFLFASYASIAQITHTATYSSANLTLANDSSANGVFTKVEYTGLFNTGQPGQPSLPVQYLKFVIPNGMEVDQVTVSPAGSADYNLTKQVLPAQPPTILSPDIPPPAFVQPDSVIYNSAQWPVANYTMSNTDYFDWNNTVVSIAVYPVQYLPNTNILRLFSSIGISISLKTASNARALTKINRSDVNQNMYKNMLKGIVANPNDVSNYSDTSIYASDTAAMRLHIEWPMNLPAYEYVVITDASLASSFADFVAWKKRKGIDIGIVTTQEIYANYPDGDYESKSYIGGAWIYGPVSIGDDAGRIREYLKDAYHNGTSYALLGGDGSFVPIRNGFAVGENVPSDWYYTEIHGNWDFDGDGLYGEFAEDVVGDFPDIFLGRLLCHNQGQIKQWTENILLYEKNPGNGDYDYLTKSFLTQSWPCQDPTGGEATNIANTDLTFTTNYVMEEEPCYHAEYDINGNCLNVTFSYPYINEPCPGLTSCGGTSGTVRGTEIVNEMKNRYGFYSFFGHGKTYNGFSGIQTMNSYSDVNPWIWWVDAKGYMDGPNGTGYVTIQETNNGLDNLDNESFPSIAYFVSCELVPFDKTSSPLSSPGNLGMPNFGEQFTTGANSGAAAFLGNTRFGYVTSSMNIEACFINRVKTDLNSTPPCSTCFVDDFSSLGLAEAFSKVDYLEFYLRYSHNLIGCPEMKMWTLPPRNINVTSVTPSVQNNTPEHVSLDIQPDISGTFGQNIEITVCLYKENEVFMVQHTFVTNSNPIAHVDFYPVLATMTGNSTVYYTVTAHNYIPVLGNIPVQCVNFVSTPWVLPSDVTMNSITNSERDIVIPAGRTLTVTSILSMNPLAKITVMPGGTLVVDQGKITSNCSNQLWKGIEVVGTKNQPQIPQYQGTVIFKNNAELHNAYCGISTCKHNSGGLTDWNTTGGIVRIDNSSFYNCRKSIEFLSYHPVYNIYQPNPNVPTCWARKCKFEVNTGIATTGTTPDAFISLYDVENLVLEGCSFSNLAGDGILMTGINSIDARYSVKPYVTGGTTTKCTFTNLSRGINISNANIYKVPRVEKCQFTGNLNGITVYGTSGFVAQQNIFSQGSNWPGVQRVGIFIQNSKRYFVSENDFTMQNLSLVIDNSGTQANEIYRNYVHHGNIGIQAQGINGNTTGGLQLKCNNFYGTNAVNFGITGNIAPVQGYCSDAATPAGNRFSQQGGSWDIFANSSVAPFTYNYHNTAYYILDNFTVSNVYPNQCLVSFNTTTSCPSKITTGGTNTTALKAAIAQSQTQLNQAQTLIAAGNTTTLLNTASSGSAVQAKNAILAVSPYTSDAVLIAAVNRNNPLPPGHLKDVIVANSPVTTPVMDAINSKSIPIGIKRQILNAQTGVSARETVEKEIAALQTSIGLQQDELIRAYMADSTINGTDSTIVYLVAQNDPTTKTLLCDAYLTKNDCNAALAIVNQMPSGTQDEQYMKQLYELKANLCSQGKTYFDITPTEKSLVETIAQSNTDASIQAKAILVLLDNVYIPVEIDALEMPDSLLFRGTVLSGAGCGNNPVENYTLILTDENNNPITSINPVSTDENGEFKFDYFETLGLDSAMLFGIATQGGFKIGSLGYKTIKQWIDGSPWTITLEDVSEMWVATMSHNDSLDDAATALDLQGSVFVTGSGRSLAYGYDIVTVKYNAAGEELWLADYNNHDTLNYDDYATALDVNSQGQAYVTGYGMDAEGAYDFLTLKYDTAGTLLWSQRYTGGYEDKAVSVVADNTAKSGALVTGSTQNSQDRFSIMTIKYNPDGSVYWQKLCSDPDGFMIIPVKALTDVSGNFYIAANTFADKPFFNLLKYDANGTLLWKKDYKYSDSDILSGIAIDVSGQIILSGTSTNAGINEVTTVAYNSSGTLIWAKHYALSGSVSINSYDVAADQSGNIFVAGGTAYGIKTICYNTTGGTVWEADEAYSIGEILEKLKVFPANDKKCAVAAHALVPMSGRDIVKTTKLIMYKNDGTELWKKVSDQWSGISSLGVSVNDNVYLAGSTKFYENGIAKNSMTTAKYAMCPGTSELLKQDNTANNISQINQEMKFELYPNPAKDEVNIRINKPLTTDADVCIYNFQGDLIKCLHINKGTSQYAISTTEFANGIYLVQIKTSGWLPENRKLIILK